jgi:hypothetical protein
LRTQATGQTDLFRRSEARELRWCYPTAFSIPRFLRRAVLAEGKLVFAGAKVAANVLNVSILQYGLSNEHTKSD